MIAKCCRTVSTTAVFLCVVGAATQDASAQETPSLQELFQSETVIPQEENELQITLAPQFVREADGRGWRVPLRMEYGLTNSFQIQADWLAYVSNRPDDEPAVHGTGDVEVGGRYTWMHVAGSNAHAALGLDFTIPTGDEDKDLGEGTFAATPVFIAAYDLASLPGAQLLANVGAEIRESATTEWFVNLAAIAPVGPAFATMEWNIAEHENFLTPGLVWHPAGNLEFGVGVPIGLSGRPDRYRVIVSFTVEFDR